MGCCALAQEAVLALSHPAPASWPRQTQLESHVHLSRGSAPSHPTPGPSCSPRWFVTSRLCPPGAHRAGLWQCWMAQTGAAASRGCCCHFQLPLSALLLEQSFTPALLAPCFWGQAPPHRGLSAQARQRAVPAFCNLLPIACHEWVSRMCHHQRAHVLYPCLPCCKV